MYCLSKGGCVLINTKSLSIATQRDEIGKERYIIIAEDESQMISFNTMEKAKMELKIIMELIKKGQNYYEF